MYEFAEHFFAIRALVRREDTRPSHNATRVFAFVSHFATRPLPFFRAYRVYYKKTWRNDTGASSCVSHLYRLRQGANFPEDAEGDGFSVS